MIFRHAFTLLLIPLLGAPAAAQDRTDEIRALVRQGDVEAALELAREYAREQPDDASAVATALDGGVWIAFVEVQGFASRIRLVKLNTE